MERETPESGAPATWSYGVRAWTRALRAIWLPVLAFLGIWLLTSRFSDVREATHGARLGLVALALLLLLGQLWPSSLLWSTALRRLTVADHDAEPTASPTPREVFRAAAAALPARYLPGSVWYAATRATVLARGHRIDPTVLATTALLELLLTLVGAITLGALALLASGRDVLHPVLLTGAAGAALIVASPKVSNRLLHAVARRRDTAALTVTWGDLAALGGWVLVHWLWATTSFLVYLRAFPALSDAPIAVLAGAFLVSWAVGFLTLLAPQGAGVFEVTLAAVLASTAATGVATPTAALVIGGHRALVVVRDVLLALPAIAATRRARHGPAGH